MTVGDRPNEHHNLLWFHVVQNTFYNSASERIVNKTMLQNSNIIVIAVLVSIKYGLCQNQIGQVCTIKKANVKGECKLVQDCPAAIKALSLHLYNLQICGFQGPLAIVCCEPSNNPPFITSSTTTIKPITTPRMQPSTVTPIVRVAPDDTTLALILRVGDKSRAKCLEYKQYVYSYPVLGGTPVDECKAKSGLPLIIGGELARSKEFPHMALIGYKNKTNNDKPMWLCGGSLISERFVLTAGHCLKDATYKEAEYVRIGDLVIDTNSDDASPQDFKIIKRIKHPKYFPPSRYNDIGLVKLGRDAILDSYVRPACLDIQPTINLNTNPIATGWGHTGLYSPSSKALLKVTLEYFDQEKCNTSYKSNIGISLRKGIVPTTQLCAGSHNDTKDACQGDSGGPLQVYSEDVYCMYTIVGITSFGKTCGVANIPGVYTRVYNYIEWIESIVWP
ncbi:hypothetical protein ILUMI_04830 [Ignelater luminosus]|uniref:Peptidase S1 domain-containing protein n=1 Tax=Ignelater luminosus TaxID=2038154 RepID=A0A8K0D880_IGNLU|nr:hypothetical protein ILUMI_04830 [Ignelater luminosus]